MNIKIMRQLDYWLGLSSKNGARLAIILIVVLTSLVYANSLKNSFVWDDFLVIVDNDFVKSWKNFPAIFSKAYLTHFSDIDYLGMRDIGSGETSYRPMVTISYFLDYQLWKLNPFGYHLTNLLLHIFNCILVYFFIDLIVKNKKLALLASLLFALHPINSEAVGVISFREDLLVFLFSISAFILFIKAGEYNLMRKISFYFISVVFFFLALFSKETAIIFPILLVLYDYFFKKIPKNILSYFKSRYLGYLIVLLFYFLIRFFLMGNIDKPRVAYPMNNFYTNLLTMSKVFATYIQWTLFPINIHPTLPDDPSLISYSLFEPKVIVSISLIIILFTIAVKIRKKLALLSFAMFWFFITLIPVSNIFFAITNYIASRYLYLPMLGLCFLIAVLLFELPNFKISSISPIILQKVARNTVIALLIFYSMFTIIRNIGWKNNIVLWLGMVEKYPNNALAHSSLGTTFRKNGLLDKAIGEYKIALSLDPNYAKDYNALGVCYYEKGMLDEAMREFKKALALDSSLLDAYVKLGVTYARMKKWNEARKIWEKAVEINAGCKEARDNLEKLKGLSQD